MEARQVFSIRKLKSGVASVLIAAAFLAVSAPQIRAAEAVTDYQLTAAQTVAALEPTAEATGGAIAVEPAVDQVGADAQAEAAAPSAANLLFAAGDNLTINKNTKANANAAVPSTPVPTPKNVVAAVHEPNPAATADSQQPPATAAKVGVYIPPADYAIADDGVEPAVQEVISETTTVMPLEEALAKMPPIPDAGSVPEKYTFDIDVWERDPADDPEMAEPYLQSVRSVYERSYSPFETEYVDDPTLPKGVEILTQMGQYGETEDIVVYYTYSDGSVVTEKLSELNVFPVFNQVITRGTKAVAEVTVTERATKETLPMYNATEYKADPNLPAGQRVVGTPGKNGKYGSTQDEVYFDDVLITTRYRDYFDEPAVNRVVWIGTKDAAVVRTGFDEKITDGRFEIIYRNNPDLPAGIVIELYEGAQPAHHTRNYVTYKDDVKVHTLAGIEAGELYPGSPKIIEYNFENTTIQEESHKMDEDFYLDFLFNPDLAFGELKLVQAGKPGQTTIYEQVFYADGAETHRIAAGAEMTVPVEPARYEFGAKGAKGELASHITDIAFETTIRENSDLEPGQVKLIQPGVLGQYIVVTDEVYDANGQVAASQSYRNLMREPVNEIIEISSWADFADQEYLLYHDTRFRFNPDLEIGTNNIITVGQDGKQLGYVINYPRTADDNVQLTEVKIAEPTVTEVIEVGTKGAIFDTQGPYTETMAFRTLYEYSDDYYEGYAKLLQAGQNGVKTITHQVAFDQNRIYIGEETTEAITTPVVNELFLVGTKPRPDAAEVAQQPPIVQSAKATRMEIMPFEEIIIEDPHLVMGTDITEVTGVNGLQELVEFVISADGQEIGRDPYASNVIIEPVTQIRRIGVKPNSGQSTNAPTPGKIGGNGSFELASERLIIAQPSATTLAEYVAADQMQSLLNTGRVSSPVELIGLLLAALGGTIVFEHKHKNK